MVFSAHIRKPCHINLGRNRWHLPVCLPITCSCFDFTLRSLPTVLTKSVFLLYRLAKQNAKDTDEQWWQPYLQFSFARPIFTRISGITCVLGLPCPANTSRSPNVGTMLGQRRRRWLNIVPTLGGRLVFAVQCGNTICIIHLTGDN